MILSFKTTIDGNPTCFREKILVHLGKDAILNYFNGTDELSQQVAHEGLAWIKPKKLTIRDDPNNRWKPGRKIHFATGARTKNYECFAEGECKEVKRITFLADFNVLQVFIDGDKVNTEEWNQLAQDDGFDNLGDFNKFHWNWDKMPLCGSITKKIIYF